MQMGLVGLGRMGGNMARRLIAAGHEIVAWDRDPAAVEALAPDGVVAAQSIPELMSRLSPPRAIWLMVPSGAPTEQAVAALAEVASPNDVIIDGGNSYFIDDVRRARELGARGVHYVDVGTSGGVWGAERGYCLMIGGSIDAVSRLTPVFESLAPGEGGIAPTAGLDPTATTAHRGYVHCGPSGSGHFVKMIHNGIEYGLMQSYAEGFEILKRANDVAGIDAPRYDLNVADIAEVWRRGSVVSSWLLDLAARALRADPTLSQFAGSVADSGEGRWTVAAAIDEEVAAPVLTAALFARFRSRRDHTFGEKLLSALRAQFGGHVEQRR